MTDTTANPSAEPLKETESPKEEIVAAAQGDAAVNPVEALTREAADLKDKLLRALAEMENLRRRAEREVADTRQYGIAGFARDVLGVADNMRRALDTVGADLREGADGNVKALIDGVELTERDLLKVMEKHGVKRVDPLGEKFDPNLHQAMYEVPDPSIAPGTVAQVMQVGYTIGDRVLRPALVGVAKGGPKPAPDGGEAASETTASEATQQGTA